MKKRIKFAGLCAAVFVVSFAVTGLIAGRGRASEAPPAPSAVCAEEPPELKEPCFIVAELSGSVVVYRGFPDGEPVIVTGISTSSLRAVDRDMLRAGIMVHSHEEALRLLEDLGS